MILVVMGVAGAGKTTVGRRLARVLGYGFSDADDFHPPANVARMRSGIALTDEDREPWLARLRSEIERWRRDGVGQVLACSALKARHRARLGAADPQMRFIHLQLDPQTAAQRLRGRRDHFFDPRLLEDQFDALEEPGPGEAIVVDADQEPEAIVDSVLAALGLRAGG